MRKKKILMICLLVLMATGGLGAIAYYYQGTVTALVSLSVSSPSSVSFDCGTLYDNEIADCGTVEMVNINGDDRPIVFTVDNPDLNSLACSVYLASDVNYTVPLTSDDVPASSSSYYTIVGRTPALGSGFNPNANAGCTVTISPP